MNGKKILLLLGGTYHDFDGYAAAMEPVLAQQGHRVQVTYDLDALTRLTHDQVDLLLMYTCLDGSEENAADTGLTMAQTEALTDWVRRGGGLLAAHAATVTGKVNPTFGRLVGGAFVSHPPQFVFTLYPTMREHPITAGVEAFAVHDELYVQTYDETVAVHMVAVDRGVCYPMVWTRTEGDGRVVHVAPGHGPRVWALPAYQRLMVQAVEWLSTAND
jgi:hypothetical protein